MTVPFCVLTGETHAERVTVESHPQMDGHSLRLLWNCGCHLKFVVCNFCVLTHTYFHVFQHPTKGLELLGLKNPKYQLIFVNSNKHLGCLLPSR